MLEDVSNVSIGTVYLSKTVEWVFCEVAVNICNLLSLNTAAHHKSEINLRGIVTEDTEVNVTVR